jgi:hypothetical protein
LIDTAEKRRSVIDFGKIRGTGMPIPGGTHTAAYRSHILNLYAGILPTNEFFFFWRNRTIESSRWANRVLQTSNWKTPTDANDSGWVSGKSIRDS